MIMSYPSGPARYDCTGPEWMELFRSRRQAEEIWTKIQKVQGSKINLHVIFILIIEC